MLKKPVENSYHNIDKRYSSQRLIPQMHKRCGDTSPDDLDIHSSK